MRSSIYFLSFFALWGALAFGADDLPQPKKDLSTPTPLPRLTPSAGDGEFSRSHPGELQKLLDQLRRDIGTLRNERKETTSGGVGETVESPEEELARLRRRYEDLWKRVATREPRPAPAPLPSIPKPAGPDPTPAPAPSTSPRGPEGPVNVGIVDPVGMAQNLFHIGDYAAALQAFRKAEEAFTQQAEASANSRTEAPLPEERMPVKYMIATCLRRLGKAVEAEAIYREVANSRGDEFVAECARWQLATLTWKRQTEAELAGLRQRNKTARAAFKALEDRP